MNRRRTSALVAASVVALLLAAWWAQRGPDARLPVIAPRGEAAGRDEGSDAAAPLAEVAAAEATRATREVATVPEGEAAAGEVEEAEDAEAPPPEEEAPTSLRYGRVVDARTGDPLSQAYVARGDGAWRGDLVPDQAIERCDGNGCFALSLVPPEPFDRDAKVAVATGFERYGVLIAVADGYERHAFGPKQLSEDPGAPTVIALARAATLLARVVDRRGVPQFDVDIDLISNHQGRLWICAATDELGEVRFVGLPPDVAYEVTLRPRRGPRLQPWRDPKPLKLEAGEERKQEWQLGGGATVRGRARDQHGRPVARRELVLTQKPGGLADASAARVYLSGNESHQLALVATSDDEGRFTFDEVAEGAWWLGPARVFGGQHVSFDRQEVAAVGQRIEVAAGVATVDVDLAFHRGLLVGGKVFDATGPLAFSMVRAKAIGGGVEGVVAVSSSEDGSFRLGPLEPGTYSLTAESPLGAASASPLELFLDTPRNDLRLEVSAGTLLVLVCRIDEQVDVTIKIDGTPRRVVPLLGVMTFECPVPAGRVQVEWSAGARTGAKEVELAPGERVEVVVGE